MFEYKCIPAYNEEKENTDRLNTLAKQGWRVISVLGANSPGRTGQFILERTTTKDRDEWLS